MAITNQVSRKVLVLQNTDAEVSTNQVYAAHYEWRVDGELTLPVPTVIDSLKHGDAAFSIYRVDVSVNVGGTSTYQILIKSYDTAGLNPITHVSEYITIAGNKNRAAISVLNAAVPQNRSLECTVYESTALIPASDMTVTLVAEDFANMDPARDGHRILNEAAVVQAQRPDIQFTDSGVAQVSVSDDSINNRTVINVEVPATSFGFIGQYLHSDLTLAQHQLLYGAGWVLADGVTSCVGSTYGTVTGRTVVPDARSMILRGKNHTRADAFADPDGDKALGTQTQDKFESHTHTYTATAADDGTYPTGVAADAVFHFRNPATIPGGISGLVTDTISSTGALASTGGNETAPKTLTVNIFIKIS